MVFRKDYPSLDVSRARVVLVEMQDRLLAPFAERSRSHALDTLRSRGVDVRLGVQVAEVSGSSVELADGTTPPCQTLLWAAGVRANPLVDVAGVPQGGGGRIAVDPGLPIPGPPDRKRAV